MEFSFKLDFYATRDTLGIMQDFVPKCRH